MKIILIIAFMIFHIGAWAAPMDAFVFESDAQEKTFRKLSDELRCLVCQNQSISGSNSDLAKDLRAEIFEMLQAGKTEEQIKEFMADRYGDYVLYEPPLKPLTWLLWFGPMIIFLVGLYYVRGFFTQQGLADAADELSAEEIARVKELQSSLSAQKNTANNDNMKGENE